MQKCKKEVVVVGREKRKSVAVFEEGLGGMVNGGVRKSVGGWKT